MKGMTGDIEVLIIPVVANNLVKGEKGIYLDLMGFEIKDKKADRKDTHLVKQSMPKEVYEAMSEQDRKDSPILGNMIVWGFQEPSPNEFPVGDNSFDPQENDLPF
jgi:hypothetical protein